MISIQEKIVDISPKEQSNLTYHTEAELTSSYGRNSLAFFGLSPENLHFLAPGGAGLVNYRLVSNVAVVLGDPVCSLEACEQVTRSFLDFCARQKWHVAFYQASPEHLATYRALKLHTFKMGEEALLHPQTFTLSGSALANVRTSSRRAERDGVIIQMPTKKPRGGELTAEQKAVNQALACRRVAIEHVNSSIKRCRILKDVCRLLRSGVRDQIMEICCALHNFRLRLDPWLPMS